MSCQAFVEPKQKFIIEEPNMVVIEFEYTSNLITDYRLYFNNQQYPPNPSLAAALLTNPRPCVFARDA